MENHRADPAQVQYIMQTALGFWKSKVLLVAVELGVFTRLGRGGKTLPQLREELGLHERGSADFLDALVALGFLERDGVGEDAVYRNTESSAVLLDKSSPDYMGGLLEMTNARVYPFWNNLTDALQTGAPQNEIRSAGQSWYEALFADRDRLEQFISAMAGYQIFNFRALVENFDFGRYDSFCDVGGASGSLAIEVARRYPNVRCITFDLPDIENIAERHVADAGLSDRVRVMSGDFQTDPLPRADVISMGNILHNWSVDMRRTLIAKAYEALPSGGAFLAIEHLVDDARQQNLPALLMSLNMLIETQEGSESTVSEFDSWCREAGFSHTEIVPVAGGTSAGVAYKP